MLVYILVGVDTLVYVLAWAVQAPLRAPREERGEREEREERVTHPPKARTGSVSFSAYYKAVHGFT